MYNMLFVNCLQCQKKKQKEEFYIHVPSPIGLIGWNIQHMTKVFEGVTCPSRALPPNARTIDIAWSTG